MGTNTDPCDISIGGPTTQVTITNPGIPDTGGGQSIQINLNQCANAQLISIPAGSAARPSWCRNPANKEWMKECAFV